MAANKTKPTAITVDSFLKNFAQALRKDCLAGIDLAGGLEPLQAELAKLGKYSTGKGRLYIKSLEDVDTVVFKKLLAKSYESVK